MFFRHTAAPGPDAYSAMALGDDYVVNEPPLHIDFGVTNYCNLSCSFCDVGIKGVGLPFYERLVNNQGVDGHHERRVLMPREELIPVLDQLAAWMPNGTFSIIHAEPLIHPHIAEIVSDFTTRKLNVSITTNGTVMGKKAESLVKAGLRNINVSFDGPPEIHDAVRGPGKYALTEAALQELLAIRKAMGATYPTVRLQYVLVADTVAHMTRFVESWRHVEGIASLQFHFLFHTTAEAAARTRAATGAMTQEVSGADPNVLNIDMDEFARQHEAIDRMDLPFEVRFKPDLPSVDHVKTYYHDSLAPVVTDKCEIPLKSLYVSMDGMVTMIPRCSFDNIHLGNIYEKTLPEIWNDEPVRRWRKFLAESPVYAACARCCGLFSGKRLGALNYVDNPGQRA